MEQEAKNKVLTVEESVLLNGLILERLLSFLPFRQFLESRLVCGVWNDAVRRTISTRARIDISLCTMVKKGEDKKRSEVEEKLDLIEFLRISELQIGIEAGLHPVIGQAFQEIGPLLRKLTIKINLEKETHFSDFFTLLGNCANLKELIWWGVIDENICQKYSNSVTFPSIEKLSLGFYSGEVQTLGKRAVLWITSIFPEVRLFSCLPHHREGVLRYLLSIWKEDHPAFPHLSEITIHLSIKEEDRLFPLESLPKGLKVLNLAIDGKRETGSVQEFTQEDATVLCRILEKQEKSLETLVINFWNLWKPKPLVLVEVPALPQLKSFTVTSDFSGDLSIDLKPCPGAGFPKLSTFCLAYLWGEGINRFFNSVEDWDCNQLRTLDLKIKDKLNSPWTKKQSSEWAKHLEESSLKRFPTAELVDWCLVYDLVG